MAGQSRDNALEPHVKPRKVFVAEPDRFPATGSIHSLRLRDRFEPHFVPFDQFEVDTATADLPDLSFIEPCLIRGHGDCHPATSRAIGHGVVLSGLDPPSSILGVQSSIFCVCEGAT
jgi:hypothetical protein